MQSVPSITRYVLLIYPTQMCHLLVAQNNSSSLQAMCTSAPLSYLHWGPLCLIPFGIRLPCTSSRSLALFIIVPLQLQPSHASLLLACLSLFRVTLCSCNNITLRHSHQDKLDVRLLTSFVRKQLEATIAIAIARKKNVRV